MEDAKFWLLKMFYFNFWFLPVFVIKKKIYKYKVDVFVSIDVIDEDREEEEEEEVKPINLSKGNQLFQV